MPLSDKQCKYLAIAFACFDAEPKIDYEKFKTLAGLASAASARELMRITKKKLKEEYGGEAAEGGSASASPAPASTNKATLSGKCSRGKKASAENGDVNEDEGGEESPLKKTKTSNGAGGKKKTIVKPESEAEAEAGWDDDAMTDFVF